LGGLCVSYHHPWWYGFFLVDLNHEEPNFRTAFPLEAAMMYRTVSLVVTTLLCLTSMVASMDASLSQDLLGTSGVDDFSTQGTLSELPDTVPNGLAGPGLEPIGQPADDQQVVPFGGHSAVQSDDGFGCNQCQSGGRSFYDRCGCNTRLFPWTPGHGDCDNWCVGPKWAVSVDGLVLSREDANWGRVAAAVGVDPSETIQFDQGPGARIFVTGYNQMGYGLQVGYEGINTWNASESYALVGATERFEYETSLNSVEINFFPKVPYPVKFFSGFRYIEIDEDFIDFSTTDKTLPLPADPVAAPLVYVDGGSDTLLKNRLSGFQLGARRDTWQLNEWLTLEMFANVGVYNNHYKRTDVARTVTTVINGDDLSTPDTNEFSQVVTPVNTSVRTSADEIAFLGEMGLTGIARLNRCVALRCGYQVLAIDGVEEGLEAYFVSGMNTTTQVFHGLHFGVEYRR
jgi:putative beta barrel porin BBP7